jgi:hypothetical protein
MVAMHEWQLFAVSHENSPRAVAICKACGDSRYEPISQRGGRRLPLGGDCPGDKTTPPTDVTPTPQILGAQRRR